MHSVVSYKWKKRGKRGKKEDLQWVAVWDIFRERALLSRFLANLTVEILRSKKESYSTQRALRVDTGFEEFRQTP